jgi:N-hydroxyarylamine O-acetyltransferase
MNPTRYLERIHYHGPVAPSIELLRRLHVAHLLAIPFENLSIHLGEPIVLDDEALSEKIVRRGRGGFCYELNGLFAALLRALGFQVTMLSASVMGANGEYGPEFDHMALMVTLEERWLADVGFGDAFRAPLLMDAPGEQVEGRRAYRIDPVGERSVVMQGDEGGTWRAQYSFSLEPRVYGDFESMCRYHQTSPESHFTQRRVCSLATPDGRITISGTKLLVTKGEERQERELADQREYVAALREHFGIDLG